MKGIHRFHGHAFDPYIDLIIAVVELAKRDARPHQRPCFIRSKIGAEVIRLEAREFLEILKNNGGDS